MPNFGQAAIAICMNVRFYADAPSVRAPRRLYGGVQSTHVEVEVVQARETASERLGGAVQGAAGTVVAWRVYENSTLPRLFLLAEHKTGQLAWTPSPRQQDGQPHPPQ